MKNRIRRNTTGRLLPAGAGRSLAVFLLLAFCLTGCVGNNQVGENTRAGNEALARGEYPEAMDLFQTAVNEGEQPVLAYRGLGMACMGTARYDVAGQAFEQAIAATDKKMPETVLDLQKYLASALYHQDKYEEVAELCTQILAAQKQPEGEIYFLRGASYLGQGLNAEAASDFDMAVKTDPADFQLYMDIYQCYEEQNLSGIGMNYLQSALNISGREQEDAYQRGRIYYYLEDYEKAVTELLSPAEQEYEPAMYLLGEVYLAQGEVARARNLFEEIRSQFGESASCYNGLAMCDIAQEDYPRALEHISQGLALDDPEYAQDLSYHELITYERMLDYATARQKAQDYVARYPADQRGQKELVFLSTRAD